MTKSEKRPCIDLWKVTDSVTRTYCDLPDYLVQQKDTPLVVKSRIVISRIAADVMLRESGFSPKARVPGSRVGDFLNKRFVFLDGHASEWNEDKVVIYNYDGTFLLYVLGKVNERTYETAEDMYVAYARLAREEDERRMATALSRLGRKND
jgi:hypothetical protein|tara:strand:- start:354 stop:806 length:453 start_codon:yes stop_codon:yes gene_type:complete